MKKIIVVELFSLMPWYTYAQIQERWFSASGESEKFYDSPNMGLIYLLITIIIMFVLNFLKEKYKYIWEFIINIVISILLVLTIAIVIYFHILTQ